MKKKKNRKKIQTLTQQSLSACGKLIENMSQKWCPHLNTPHPQNKVPTDEREIALAWRKIELSLIIPGVLEKMLIKHLASWNMLTVYINGTIITDAERARWNKRIFGGGGLTKNNFLRKLTQNIRINYERISGNGITNGVFYTFVNIFNHLWWISDDDMVFIDRFYMDWSKKANEGWVIMNNTEFNIFKK